MSDKKIKLTNFEMETYVSMLEPFLDRSDKIGYAAARNTRYLMDACADYSKIKVKLLEAYGTELKDEKGNGTGEMIISADDPNFDLVKKQLATSGEISHEVTIYKISYDDVIDKLTGREILQIDWMIDK